MEFVDKIREKPLVQKIEKFFPAIAFLGGFTWDSITLGQMVESSDLIFLLAYYLGAFILIILLSAHKSTDQNYVNADGVSVIDAEVLDDNGNLQTVPQKRKYLLDREWSEKWKKRFTWAVQFCYGSLFSALVVCYFKSSGSFTTFILVVFLAVLLVCNEFLQKRYESFAITLALFCLLGTMFMNFAIPHLVHRIGFFWFFASTLISFGICALVWFISHRKLTVLIAPGIICLLLTISYLVNLVPPVPLVMKQQMVCTNFDKNTYTGEIDIPSYLQYIGVESHTIHKRNKKEIHFVSSVYAPTDLKALLEYRWYYADPITGKFQLEKIISSSKMVLTGGRESGYRSYVTRYNLPEGIYRVETAYSHGAVIGSMTFKVLEGEPENGVARERLQ